MRPAENTSPAQVRNQLKLCNRNTASPTLRKAHECYVDLEEDAKLTVDYLLSDLIHAMQERAQIRGYGKAHFGPITALELLGALILKGIDPFAPDLQPAKTKRIRKKKSLAYLCRSCNVITTSRVTMKQCVHCRSFKIEESNHDQE